MLRYTWIWAAWLGCAGDAEPVTVKVTEAPEASASADTTTAASKATHRTQGPVEPRTVIGDHLRVEPMDLKKHRAEMGDDDLLRMGYFHGGRNLLLYRAMDDGAFRRAGVDVSFWSTRGENNPEFYMIPDRVEEVHAYRDQNRSGFMLGRTTGPQLIEQLRLKRLDCAMIGESSFLLMVRDGLPATAIAKLGQDQKDTPGKVVLVREDIEINSAQDLVGRSMGSRKGGPYDAVMVREFLEEQGVDPASMDITDNIPQEKLKKMLKRGKLEIVFLHLNRAANVIGSGDYKLYPNFKFSFANPNLSHSILVCRDEIIKKKRSDLIRFLSVYKDRVDYENSLSRAERAPFDGHKTLAMDTTAFPGFNLPQYDPIPLLDAELLDEMQRLLIKHGHLDGPVPFRKHIDMSMMQTALDQKNAKPGKVTSTSTQAIPNQNTPYVGSNAVLRMMKIIDSNQDGYWDFDEVQSAAWEPLKAELFDLDKDGRLNPSEVERFLWTVDPLTPEYRGRQHNLRNMASSESE